MRHAQVLQQAMMPLAVRASSAVIKPRRASCDQVWPKAQARPIHSTT